MATIYDADKKPSDDHFDAFSAAFEEVLPESGLSKDDQKQFLDTLNTIGRDIIVTKE